MGSEKLQSFPNHRKDPRQGEGKPRAAGRRTSQTRKFAYPYLLLINQMSHTEDELVASLNRTRDVESHFTTASYRSEIATDFVT